MKKIVVIALALFTAACADNKSMILDYGTKETKAIQKIDPAIGYSALQRAPLCCESLSTLDYHPIVEPGKFDFTVTEESTAFKFSTGKSFVQGFTLPKANGVINVTISAPIVTSVFVPTALILDEQYKPMQVYGSETIKYDASSLLNVDRFFGEIALPAQFSDGRQAKYLLILTTDEAMQNTTELAEPYAPAESLGRTDIVSRIYLDKPIPHTATGVFRLALDYLPSSQHSANTMIQQTSNDVSQKQADAVLVQDKTTVAKVTIQPETEAMFIGLIDQAVKNGDSTKALQFVDEAELAGSTKARDALFEAMKKYQK
ncbi:hypothetical protein GCM10007916_23180 [Psychromonas marina]|uniref:Maltose operon protein n=1 Tax=Psychromonas marina TaxID=88364 RepID=A0ABQ6E1E7_9GAMM|nr:MalM family protein [Psychromonas marina]GLS91249.1 hypothetical protein GCM10007916_23180 [Psychromonas marina]